MCSCRSGFQLASDGMDCDGRELLLATVIWLRVLMLKFLLQTSMSVALTMVAVLTTVPILRALSRAAAEVDFS